MRCDPRNDALCLKPRSKIGNLKLYRRPTSSGNRYTAYRLIQRKKYLGFIEAILFIGNCSHSCGVPRNVLHFRPPTSIFPVEKGTFVVLMSPHSGTNQRPHFQLNGFQRVNCITAYNNSQKNAIHSVPGHFVRQGEEGRIYEKKHSNVIELYNFHNISQ